MQPSSSSPSGSPSQADRRPLSGLRVVDLSDTLPGIQATQFLADNGAEVIHVERPGGCSVRRHPAWPALGRGKKSIVLDLNVGGDHEVAFNLAASADVLVECFRPGVAHRLGVGYDSLSPVNPRLVYTSITGWGHGSAYARAKGYEGLVAARLGAFDAIAQVSPRPGPSFFATNAASYGAMHSALQGTLAALLEREESGRGQHIETSLAMGLASVDVWNWALRMVGGRFPDAFVNASAYVQGIPQNHMFFRLFICQTNDARWLQFSQVQPRLFRAFMRAVDLEWMFDDPEWSTVPEFPDQEKRVKFWGLLLQRTRQKSMADWNALFDADNNVFGEVFRRGTELLDHPQLIHNKQVTVIDDPALGPVRQPAPLVRFIDDPITLSRSAPALDEHGTALRAAPRRMDTPSQAPNGQASARRLPLEGVTVLELAFFFAAPYGATLLTDLGARVIKVEPLEGDPIRHMLGFPEVAGMHVFQGKHSVALDIKAPEGQEIVRQLGERADVLLTSFRPGTLDRLGIGPAALRKANPALVVMNAMGYGIDGPYAEKPAFAPSISAGSGISMRNIGPSVQARPNLPLEVEKAESVRLAMTAPGLANPDGFSSTAVASGLLLGLLGRARTGQAQRMLTSMMGTSAHVLADQMVDYQAMAPVPAPDDELFGMSARYRLYETADGWVFLAAPDERQWDVLAAALIPEATLASDPRFVDPGLRAANDAELADQLAKAFHRRPAPEWEERLLAVDVGCVALPGREPEHVYQSEFGRESGYLAAATHPMIGDYERAAPSMSFSRSRTQALGGCLVGDHTRLVLSELGYDDSVIDDLAGRGIIGMP